MSAWEKVDSIRPYGMARCYWADAVDAARAEDAERLKQAQTRLAEFSHCTDCGLIWTGNNLDCPACIAQAAALSVSQLCVERDALKQAEREAFIAGFAEALRGGRGPESGFTAYLKSRQPVSSNAK